MKRKVPTTSRARRSRWAWPRRGCASSGARGRCGCCCRRRCRCESWCWRRAGLRTVSAARVRKVEVAIIIFSAPDDHFAASPHRLVSVSGRGRVAGAGSRPTVGARIISPAGIQIAAVRSAPDDHFSAGPDCRVARSGVGRVAGAGGHPTVGARIISPAGIKIARQSFTAPDDHLALAAGPHRRVRFSCSRRVGRAGRCPTIGGGIISSSGIQRGDEEIRSSPPHDHFAASPHCRVPLPANGGVGGASCCPTVGARIIFPAGIKDCFRPRRSFHFRSTLPCESLVQQARLWCW